MNKSTNIFDYLNEDNNDELYMSEEGLTIVSNNIGDLKKQT